VVDQKMFMDAGDDDWQNVRFSDINFPRVVEAAVSNSIFASFSAKPAHDPNPGENRKLNVMTHNNRDACMAY
jgi:hypothetical protein